MSGLELGQIFSLLEVIQALFIGVCLRDPFSTSYVSTTKLNQYFFASTINAKLGIVAPDHFWIMQGNSPVKTLLNSKELVYN